jgi:hypothetical protein
LAVLVGALLWPVVCHSLTIEIAGPSNTFSPFADFLVIHGNASDSSPGQVVEILGGAMAPSLQSNGSESNFNSVAITDLQITLERPGGSLVQFSLLSDAVRVFNDNQGQSTAEARFELTLGFDFMNEYTEMSTNALSI